MSEKSQNPWLTIWVEPKATIRQIVTENPKRALWVLAAVYGFSSLLNAFQSAALGNQVGAVALFFSALLLSPIWGYVVFSVWSWVICWTGKWLKGEGDFQKVRAAYAWSCVPITLNGVLWIFLILLFGRPLFVNFPHEYFLTNGQISLLFFILIAKVVLAIWSLIIYFNALAEVQQFSVLKAIGNTLLAAVLVGIVCGVMWTLALQLFGVVVETPQTTLHILQDGKLLETVWRDL